MFDDTVVRNCLSAAEHVCAAEALGLALPLPIRKETPRTTEAQTSVAAMRRRSCTKSSIGPATVRGYHSFRDSPVRLTAVERPGRRGGDRLAVGLESRLCAPVGPEQPRLPAGERRVVAQLEVEEARDTRLAVRVADGGRELRRLLVLADRATLVLGAGVEERRPARRL